MIIIYFLIFINKKAIIMINLLKNFVSIIKRLLKLISLYKIFTVYNIFYNI
jgi:hypothetical protein